MEHIVQRIKEHPLLVGASAVAVLMFARKLYQFAQKQHSVLLVRNGEKQVVDPALFPQYFTNAKGLWLFMRKWEVPNPKGVLFICHGYGEHIGRYEHVAQHLNAHGFAVYGMDHQGHGQSEGDMAHVENFDEFHQDYLAFVKHVVTSAAARGYEIAHLPRFLLGHSMGGLIGTRVVLNSTSASFSSSSSSSTASSAAAEVKGAERKDSSSSSSSSSAPFEHRWTGYIASAPALTIDPSVDTPFMRFLARVLSRTLPKLPVTALDAATVSRIPAITQRYKADPLVYHGGIRALFGFEMLRAIADVLPRYAQFRTPLLVVHGTGDRLTGIGGSRALFEGAAAADKTFLPYEGGFHELFNDTDHARVMADLTQWLEKRV